MAAWETIKKISSPMNASNRPPKATPTTPTYAQFIRNLCANNGIAFRKLDRVMAQADYQRLYGRSFNA